MSILLIGDPHFKNNNIKETDKFVDETLKYINDNKKLISFIVILGDVLHTHEKINLNPFYRATNFINALSKFTSTYIIVGNHDRVNNKAFLTDVHSLIGFKHNKNIKIIDDVYKIDDFIFVPYGEPGRFQEALDTKMYDMENVKAIFCHQEFYGANINVNIVSEHGDKWDNVKIPIFSGHIHSYQKLKNNIIYVGTPYQINFGESED